VLGVLHDRGLRNVLTASVVRHDSHDGVTVLQLGTAEDEKRRLIVPQCTAVPGTCVTVAVQPWDVALAAEPVHAVSIQNQIPGMVRRCTLHERRAIVEIDIGAPLIVEVSRRSAVAMELSSGRSVVCLIKSNAVQYLAPS
jgi:molybdate transport system ATP-binding protein